MLLYFTKSDAMRKTGACLVLMVFLTILFPACMKRQCYQCTDQQGTKTEEGCNKTREEINDLGVANNWKCVILP